MAEGRFKVAAVQMVSEPEVQANLDAAGELIARAADAGATSRRIVAWGQQPDKTVAKTMACIRGIASTRRRTR